MSELAFAKAYDRHGNEIVFLRIVDICCHYFDDRKMGYCEWHELAKRSGRTHRQVRCVQCNLFTVWIPKVTTIRNGQSLKAAMAMMGKSK